MIFETRYGSLDLDVHSLLGAPLYVAADDILIPAGVRERSGRVLKRPVKILAGAILMPRQDKNYPEGRRWHLFPYGLYEALRSCRHMRDHYDNGEIGRRQIALAQEKERIQRTLTHFFQTRIEPLKRRADQCRKYLPSWEERGKWRKRLIVSRAELTGITAAPHTLWIKSVKEDIAVLIHLLENNKRENLLRFKELVDRLYWALRFKRAREVLEQILFIFPSHPAPEETQNLRSALLDFLERFKELEEGAFYLQVKAAVQQKVGTALAKVVNGHSSEARQLLKEAARRL